jgi:hypothetical protein
MRNDISLMKHSFLIGYCILFLFKAQSQIVVANKKMNIVYAGVDNPIEFLANNIDKAKLVVKASCGELIRTSTAKFIWRICNQKCSYVSFSIGVLKNNKFSLLGTSDYRIKKIPIPTINFGSTPDSRTNSHGGNIIKHPQFGPRLSLDDFDFDVTFKVQEFDVEICKQSGDTLRFKNIGIEFNENVKKEFVKLNIGDKICVHNIMYTRGCDEEKLRLTLSSCYVY